MPALRAVAPHVVASEAGGLTVAEDREVCCPNCGQAALRRSGATLACPDCGWSPGQGVEDRGADARGKLLADMWDAAETETRALREALSDAANLLWRACGLFDGLAKGAASQYPEGQGQHALREIADDFHEGATRARAALAPAQAAASEPAAAAPNGSATCPHCATPQPGPHTSMCPFSLAQGGPGWGVPSDECDAG